MTDRLEKLKGLLVAAHESVKEGSRETASNLMELALNEMEHLEPEDVEIGLQTVTTLDADAPVVDYEPEHANSPLYSKVSELVAQGRASHE